MWWNESINGNGPVLQEQRMIMQKQAFPVNEALVSYLQRYQRCVELPVLYNDLANYSHADSLKDKKGKWTHWENAVYDHPQFKKLNDALIATYAILKKQPVTDFKDRFSVVQVDFCAYGNSVPFRVKVIEKNINKQHFFYVKPADASRIYGFELEHLLTENPINFLFYSNTLVEEHIDGLAGDLFLQQHPHLTKAEKIVLSKAFVQFNESCFARLLGDMRSYNFVVACQPLNSNDTVDINYRFRAIDFDQQCYEGKKKSYFPVLYKENKLYVETVLQSLTEAEIEQTQQAEFTAMSARIVASRRRLMELLNSMASDDLSENYKIQSLRNELNGHFKTDRFTTCKTMGAIVKQQLKQVFQEHLPAGNIR